MIPVTVIGNGSKLLVLDGGIKGIVIKINIKKKYKKLFLSAFSQNQIFGVKLQQFSQYKRIIY